MSNNTDSWDRVPSVIAQLLANPLTPEEIVRQCEEAARRVNAPSQLYKSADFAKAVARRLQYELKESCERAGWVHALTYNDEMGGDEVWISPTAAARLGPDFDTWDCVLELEEGVDRIEFSRF